MDKIVVRTLEFNGQGQDPSLLSQYRIVVVKNPNEADRLEVNIEYGWYNISGELLWSFCMIEPTVASAMNVLEQAVEIYGVTGTEKWGWGR